MQSDLLIYKDDNGNVAIDVRLEDETVWLSQVQMAELFGKGRTTITEHIRNIFREGELVEEMVCRKFRHTSKHGAIKGKTQKSEVIYYNLDVIISVGYRVKSQQGTQFRIWATSRLKDYLIKGYAINQQRLLQNSQELQQALV
ncbi:virulence RhuM family protein [Pasteurella atlantica]|uniref:virulence RhuM family protein n=1 Tax=Pasteurellaceae TaxID=712 RepID=UPI002771F857|nr:RhuM family protein [Pasteurella atlantica]MDP8100091.1 RhuM family protein [Pasteurella atlantica]MDP8108008.1 RhuM family protein [Pasteurella atlantica]MDP8117730.1 RhuM family protein [Pasteurella atlantica]